MPQHQSAIKRVRQNEKRRKHNQAQISKMRTLIKKVYETEEKQQAEKHLKEATSYIDKVASRGLIHQNNAARKKSKLTTYVNNLE
ncbi:MAG: 30S ribosomal protein S20 [Balneolaceae bacterium]|nr:30S ribosomal protein S20 [Balneolaceae bacterium]